MMKMLTYALVLCMILVAMIAPVHAEPSWQPGTPFSITLADMGYGDLTLEGLNATGSFWVPFQPDWSLEGTEIEIVLEYTASPLLASEFSTVTVLVENSPVTSFVPVTDGQAHSETFTIPSSQVTSNVGFTLQILGVLAINDDPCQEFDNPAQWLRIGKATTINYAPAYNTGAPVLTDITARFAIPNMFQGNSQNLFVLPDDLDSTNLTAAARVSARLGQQGRNVSYAPVTAVRATELSEEQRDANNLVVVGTAATLPFVGEMSDTLPITLGDGVYTTPDGGSVPNNVGVIQIYNSSVNPARLELLVSGTSDEGLTRAGEAFSHTPTFNAFDGPYQLASALLPVQTSDLAGAWLSNVTSFAQLGISDITVRGVGTFQHYVTFRFPPGWEFTQGTTLTLDLAASPVMNTEQSHVAIFINEVPIGSTEIHPDAPLQIQFDVPQSALNLLPTGERPQQATMRIEVSNYLKDTDSACTNQAVAWTTISNTSRFDVRHEYLSAPDLQIFPYPFVADNSVAPTVIVLPADPTDQELSMGLSLASTLGRFTPTDLDLHLTTADMVDDALLADAQLILVGTTDRQPLFDQFADELNGPHTVNLFFASDTGFVQEVRSPFNADRIALLVYSATTTGLDKAVDILLDAAPPVIKRGTFLVVEEKGIPQLLDPSLDLEEAFPNPPVEPTLVPTQEAEAPSDDAAMQDEPTATPAPETGAAIDSETDMAANTQESLAEENTPPLEDDQSFVVISVVAVIMIPFAFLFTRQQA